MPQRLSERALAEDLHCSTCIFHGTRGDRITCEYILVTGRRRGCDAGPACLRYQEGVPALRDLTGPGGILSRANNRSMIRLNIAVFQALVDQYGFREIAMAIGCHVDTLYRSRREGLISVRNVINILKLYGVNVIDHTQ